MHVIVSSVSHNFVSTSADSRAYAKDPVPSDG